PSGAAAAAVGAGSRTGSTGAGGGALAEPGTILSISSSYGSIEAVGLLGRVDRLGRIRGGRGGRRGGRLHRRRGYGTFGELVQTADQIAVVAVRLDFLLLERRQQRLDAVERFEHQA